ncbi:MAG TPA: hypothetical protein VE621_16855 [Bryobacteraceae bacterium]|nr:hypothetical protein [Bryobacteraceae bacterium]
MQIAVLLAFTTPLFPSGPYTPIRVQPKREALVQDERYNAGKSIFWGDTKVGAGKTCASCHSKTVNLQRAQLLKVKENLQWHISRCVASPERVNGALQPEQMDALAHFLAKRYRL